MLEVGRAYCTVDGQIGMCVLVCVNPQYMACVEFPGRIIRFYDEGGCYVGPWTPSPLDINWQWPKKDQKGSK